MTRALPNFRRPLWQLLGSVAALLAAGMLLSVHMEYFTALRSQVLPAARQIPELEQRAALLREQIDQADVVGSVHAASLGEQVQAYVLPTDANAGRLARALEAVGDTLQKQNWVHNMRVEVGGVQDFGSGMVLRTVEVETAANEQGLQALLDLVDVSGTLSVADALPAALEHDLLQESEHGSPGDILLLQELFHMDLPTYVQNGADAMERLRGNIATPEMSNLLSQLENVSVLAGATRLLQGDTGTALGAKDLWPLPLTTIKHLTQEKGKAPSWSTLRITLNVVGRKGSTN